MSVSKVLSPLCLVVVTFLCVCGCAPRQIGATEHGFRASGKPNIAVSVAPPLRLAATGKRTAPTPSDLNINPSTSFHYAVFADTEGGPVLRHAHTILSELDRWSWRWEKETWAMPESLYYSTLDAGGKFWTVQMFPVTAATDWFSALWTENGRETPGFWLAKRWSSTPDDEIRVVAEYREPAPQCMRQRLTDAAGAGKNAPPLKGKDLRRGCDQEIDAFSLRADAVFVFDRASGREPMPGVTTNNADPTLLTSVPGQQPKMNKLVGKAEARSRGGEFDFRP